MGRRRAIRAPGLFALYVAGYSFARVGEELMRVDPAHHVLGLRLNFFVAAAVCLTGIVWFIHTQRPSADARRQLRRGGALLAAGALLCTTGCGEAANTRTYSSTPGLQNVHDICAGRPIPDRHQVPTAECRL